MPGHACNNAADSVGSMYTNTHSAKKMVGAEKSAPAVVRASSSAALSRRSAGTSLYKSGVKLQEGLEGRC